MKRAMIGGFISLNGSIWMRIVIMCADSYDLYEWTTPPGKLFTQITESNLTVWFILSAAAIVLGMVLMGVEYFRKDK